MIKSFKHKALRRFFEDGEVGGINANHAAKLARILDRLEAATGPKDMNLPGYRLHPLKGDREGTWAVWVSANWRVTFEFEGSDAVNVDYCDYH
ncbi:MAG: peptidase [Planctomycetes bacterium]|nr:peptidase [Planctomycetota bacterium]